MALFCFSGVRIATAHILVMHYHFRISYYGKGFSTLALPTVPNHWLWYRQNVFGNDFANHIKNRKSIPSYVKARQSSILAIFGRASNSMKGVTGWKIAHFYELSVRWLGTFTTHTHSRFRFINYHFTHFFLSFLLQGPKNMLWILHLKGIRLQTK